MNKRLYLLTFLLSSALVSTSCATFDQQDRAPRRTIEPSPQRDTGLSTQKRGDKRTGGTQEPSHSTYHEELVSGSQTTNKTHLMMGFIERHLDPSLPLSPDDRVFLSSLTTPAAHGSLEEAVYTLASIKASMHQGDQQIEETDYLGRPVRSSAANDLLTNAAAYELNLLRALARNPYLQDGRIWEMTVLAIQKVPVAETFVQQLQEMLQRRAQRWTQLSERARNVDGEADTNQSDQPLVHNNRNLSPADLRSGDALLASAQTSADNKNFQEAIEKISQIQQSSPFYPQAQEKIRAFSNLAVQDLRQKAAIAFQSAIPVNDPKAKLAYLEQARDLLQEALSQYPTADQLQTVKENLAVISRDLEQLVERIGE